MAYNFLAESEAPLDWGRLVTRLRAVGAQVEVFPIPSEAPTEKDAIGVSLPGKSATEEGSRQLERVLRMLLAEFPMEVTDLHSGRPISTGNLAEIRASVLGATVPAGGSR